MPFILLIDWVCRKKCCRQRFGMLTVSLRLASISFRMRKIIWINHKRVRLQVSASELYPEDYDFSIIFDTVENRKKRHDMERKYTEEQIENSE